jgi:hypothetical protein
MPLDAVRRIAGDVVVTSRAFPHGEFTMFREAVMNLRGESGVRPAAPAVAWTTSTASLSATCGNERELQRATTPERVGQGRRDADVAVRFTLT